MRAPISRQSKKCLHKMADLLRQLNSPQDFLFENNFFLIDKDLFSPQRNVLDNFLLLDNYWKLTG